MHTTIIPVPSAGIKKQHSSEVSESSESSIEPLSSYDSEFKHSQLKVHLSS